MVPTDDSSDSGAASSGGRRRRRRRKPRSDASREPRPEGRAPDDQAAKEAPGDCGDRGGGGRSEGAASSGERGRRSRGGRGRSRRGAGEGRGREDRSERKEREPRRDRPETPTATASGFQPFDLEPNVLKGLAHAGYEDPTPIQEQLIPIALDGSNVVARSRTGTGKTCAFLVPAFSMLEEVQEGTQEFGSGPPRVLIVVPVRELAIQVASESEKLSRFLPVRTVCVYGGTPLKQQIQAMPQSAIVVGTPGRILDHIGRRTLDASTIELLVLDEVDRMYDLGFREDVDRIVEACRHREQTILVSATLNDDVERLVSKHLEEHERIEIESKSMTVDEVEQMFYIVRQDRKRELLIALLEERNPERTIVFTRTRFTADRVAYVLQQKGFDASEIHSGLPQRRREEILKRFRSGRLSLLVATDVAARGLDIQGVDHVINYDIPESPEDYVHRVGRTARMGQEGWAVTLVTPDDGPYLTEIEKLINKQIEQERFHGIDVGPPVQTEGEAADEAAPAEDEPAPKPEARVPGLPRWAKPARRRR